MTGSFTYNLAVPSAALLKYEDASKLALETSSWVHLNRYVGKVENLPTAINSGIAASGTALEQLRKEALKFGSPKRLRQLIAENPNALADDEPPLMLYASIVWWVHRLHESAASVVSFSKSVMESAKSGADVKEGLQCLGHQAEKGRNPIGPLIASLKTFKVGILSANNDLSETCKIDAQSLQQMQESVGGMEYKVESLKKQIDGLGFFSSGKKKQLELELQSLRQQLVDKTACAEKLRAALGELEPILGEGYWLQSGVDDLVDFLDKLRKVWTTFGSGVAQLAADASDDQLEDQVWMKKALGFDEAIKQWTAIEQAAKQFIAESLVDIQND